jgi:hypothetical protein
MNMPISIDIESTDTQTRESKKTGKPYFLQTAYAHCFDRHGQPKRYPQEIQLIIPADGNMPRPYVVGEYTLAPNAIKVNEYGSLELGYPQLIPCKAK